MPIFSYTAIDNDGKEVRGSIDAQDMEAAKRAVEDLHMEVKEVTEATRIKPIAATSQEPRPVQPVTYAFEGTDESGAVRRGTVQAATKRDAFEHLKADQKLNLTMLSPMGVLPQFRDRDLEQWQAKEVAAEAPIKVAVPAPVQPVKKTIGFAGVPPSSTKKTEQAPVASSKPVHSYLPLMATLRLYAGWLLAWYGLFVALGYFTTVRQLPFEIPFVQAFYFSPLIFTFTAGIFIFLLLSAVHKAMHGKLVTGIFLTLVGIGLLTSLRLGL